MTDDDASSADAAAAWERLSALFDATVSLSAEARAQYLSVACAHEPRLRAELGELLEAADGAPDFLREFTAQVIVPGLDDALSLHGESEATATTPPSARVARVRHYEVLERLGAGGMGVVFRGRDTRLGREIALKFVTPDRLSDPTARRRLLREAQAASSLADRNVCAIHAIEDLADGGLCVVMQFCAGGTLRDRLRAGPLTVLASVEIATQIASGLACAHRHDIVHRDIKPANIGFDERETALILDFGIAFRADTDTTADGARVAGTLSYLAPEQLRGQASDSRADIWALGVTLHEMLTGRRPFQGETEAAVMYEILEHEIPPLTRNDGEPIPPALDRLVREMLAKDSECRPANGDALSLRLRSLASGDAPLDSSSNSVEQAPETTPTRLVRSRSRRLHAAFALGATALVVATVALLNRGRRSNEAAPLEVARRSAPLPTVVVLPFAVQGPASLEYLQEGMVDLVTPAFDATGLMRGVDPNAAIAAAAKSRGSRLDSAAAQAIANDLEVARYVVGSVVGTGAMLTIRATLRQANGAEAGRAQVVVADVSALGAAVDRLVHALIATELRAPGDTVAGMAATTTASALALRAYLDGERELRDARPAAAVAHFRRAVEQDSLFAIAWYRLARAARWSEVDSLNAHATARAFSLASSMPLRMQELVRGYHAFRFGSPVDAERQFRRIVSDHPTDVDAWMLLGETMFRNNAYYGRSTDEATAAFRRVMTLDPRNREVTVYLMELAARADRRGELDTLFRMYFDPNSAGEQPGIRQTYLALHARRTRTREGEASTAERIDDPAAAFTALRRIGAHPRDLLAARVFAAQLARPEVSANYRLAGLLALATLDVADGNLNSALAHHDAAARIDAAATLIHRATLALAPSSQETEASLRTLRQALQTTRGIGAAASATVGLTPMEAAETRLYLTGMLSLRVGDLPALTAAQRSLAKAPRSSRVAYAFSEALRGHLAKARNDLTQATSAFANSVVDVPIDVRSAVPVLEQQADRLAHAEVLRLTGSDEASARWYDSLRDGAALLSAPYLSTVIERRRASTRGRSTEPPPTTP